MSWRGFSLPLPPILQLPERALCQDRHCRHPVRSHDDRMLGCLVPECACQLVRKHRDYEEP